MDEEFTLLGDQKLSELSLKVCKYPKTLDHWEELLRHLLTKASPISKSINKELLQLIRSTYESLLYEFPLLENYHVEFALLEFKLGYFNRFHSVIENALQCFNNRSLLIWVEYLRICNKIISNNKELFSKYATAESYIGLHFFAGEFWSLYLNEIKLRCRTQHHYIRTLRKIIEIPMYDYSTFFELWLQEIDNVRDLTQLRRFGTDDDLWKKLKINTQLHGRKGPHLQEAKKALKKITKELFLVVQYDVMEIYELFESKLTKRYYVSAEELVPREEMITMVKYFNYTRKKKVVELIKLQFQRLIQPLAHYDELWLQYSEFLIDDLNDFIGAKNCLMQALSHVNKRSRVISVLSGILIRLDQISELQQLYDDVLVAYSNDLSRCDALELFIDYIEYRLFLSSTESKSRYNGLSETSEFAETILDTIVKRMSIEEDHDRQFVLLNLVNDMYKSLPRDLIRKNVYEYVVQNEWQSYQSNPRFWYMYCSLIWFDTQLSYIGRRKLIINEIVPLACKKGQLVTEEMRRFLQRYLQDDLDQFTQQSHMS